MRLHEQFDVLTPIMTSQYKPSNNIIKAKLRPCTMQLTNDSDICDKLSDIYELSDVQIQVLINNMVAQHQDESAIKMLQYIKDNKKNIPINSCKIQLAQLKEIKEAYLTTSNIEYPYKYISKNTDIDENILSGYCLSDVSNRSEVNNKHKIIDNLEDITNINKPQLYELYRFDNNYSIESITDFYCKDNTSNKDIPFDANLTFIRLRVSVSKNSILNIYKIDTVYYDQYTNKFQQQSTYDIAKLFELQVIRKQILLTFSTVETSIYTLHFDICNRIKKYNISNYVYFSFKEIANLKPKLIDNNVDLDEKEIDVKALINMKLNAIIDKHNAVNDQIQTYHNNMKEIMLNYSKLQEVCSDMIRCKSQSEYLLSKHDSIQSEKRQLESELQKLKTEHMHYVEINKKLKEVSFTLNEINDMLGTIGMPISYEKYAKFISNDDCIYLQI
jgi:hypothetical protein